MITVGVDVGGARKGFHAVALEHGRYTARTGSVDAEVIAAWCRQFGAQIIAIDAPCRWSLDGTARPAERALMKRGISCFSSPTRQSAVEHPRNYFGWMLRGEALFAALADTHPLCDRWPAEPRPMTFETFPHAITWHLTGGHCSAKQKRIQRRAVLERAGIATSDLTNIDLLDAALCALTAHHVAAALPTDHYGEPVTGYIVVPQFVAPAA